MANDVCVIEIVNETCPEWKINIGGTCQFNLKGSPSTEWDTHPVNDIPAGPKPLHFECTAGGWVTYVKVTLTAQREGETTEHTYIYEYYAPGGGPMTDQKWPFRRKKLELRMEDLELVGPA